MKGRCQRYQRGAQSSMRHYIFFGPKNYFDITIPGGRKAEREVSTVPTQCLELYESIFAYRSKNFFFDIAYR